MSAAAQTSYPRQCRVEAEDLKSGINEIEFLKSGDQGYEITVPKFQSVSQTESTVVLRLTICWHAAGRPPSETSTRSPVSMRGSGTASRRFPSGRYGAR